MQSKVAFAAALAAGLSIVGAARAAPMEFVFTGEVNFVDDLPGIASGDVLTGRFTFDSADIPGDSSPDPSVGFFLSAPGFVAGVFDVQSTTGIRSFPFDNLFANILGQNADQFEVGFTIRNAQDSGGNNGNAILIRDLTDPFFTLATINSISPFTYTFQPGDEAGGAVLLSGSAEFGFSIASAELRFIPAPAPAAPEPAALGLLGLGVAGLWRVRRRKSG